ncbi:hypothetical protein JTE90_026509 [Oedothorax gibbosus]|uniref:HTH cro/C1-type domain-containing protein n=1 Tax=Oedothorax gibbosus TaxID=931172 RepID=A0AAV6VP54_9ARAC|nr:hypothetical protein JTE90_026509 [Oedothorax gibbosus]
MSKAKQLSEKEEIKEWRKKASGLTITKIAAKMGKSLSSIYRILSSTDGLMRLKRPGRPRLTDSRDDRHLLKMTI